MLRGYPDRVPHHQTRRKRWATAARWPVGVGIAYWRYLWSTTPVHRWEMVGTWPEDAPPDLPPGADREQLQLVEEGVGPLVHRLYRTRIVGSSLDPEELMERMTADLDQVAPSEFATFQRTRGEGDGVAAGDEYVVRMPGPWDGPVRIVAADSTSFRFATLPGHLEAGQIEFRAGADYRSLWFEIESWARSGDRLSDLLYDHLRISKEVQLHMWSSVLRRVVGLTEGKMEGGLVIITRLVPERVLPDADAEAKADRGRSKRLEDLGERELNFDPAELDDHPDEHGWHHDDMVEPLPTEPSGEPVDGGSWQVARTLMDAYQLADPKVVTATYEEDAPLAGRDMLLRISFKGLPLWVGVRVGRDYEETREIEGRQVRVFGWGYDTLEGHFEEGRMYYELWKWLDSGEVEFHLRAVSRPARDGSPLIKFGFRLFGRTQQLRFYRQVCRRVRRLTEAQLETERADDRRAAQHSAAVPPPH
jgi:uncharacterized protein (UPF0548 family)